MSGRDKRQRNKDAIIFCYFSTNRIHLHRQILVVFLECVYVHTHHKKNVV